MDKAEGGVGMSVGGAGGWGRGKCGGKMGTTVVEWQLKKLKMFKKLF